MALAVNLLGDRWTMLILRETFYGVQRYDDIRADLDAPRSVLTDRLNKMVNHGLLEKQPYQEPGSRMRHAYVLTKSGRELALTLIALTQWGEDHILNGSAPMNVVERKTGEKLTVNLTTASGKVVGLTETAIQLIDSEQP